MDTPVQSCYMTRTVFCRKQGINLLAAGFGSSLAMITIFANGVRYTSQVMLICADFYSGGRSFRAESNTSIYYGQSPTHGQYTVSIGSSSARFMPCEVYGYVIRIVALTPICPYQKETEP